MVNLNLNFNKLKDLRVSTYMTTLCGYSKDKGRLYNDPIVMTHTPWK